MSAVILYPPKQKSSGKNPIFMLRWLHKQRTGEHTERQRRRKGAGVFCKTNLHSFRSPFFMIAWV